MISDQIFATNWRIFFLLTGMIRFLSYCLSCQSCQNLGRLIAGLRLRLGPQRRLKAIVRAANR